MTITRIPQDKSQLKIMSRSLLILVVKKVKNMPNYLSEKGRNDQNYMVITTINKKLRRGSDENEKKQKQTNFVF